MKEGHLEELSSSDRVIVRCKSKSTAVQDSPGQELLH